LRCGRWLQADGPILIGFADDGVTLAGGLLQSSPVLNGDDTAPIADVASILEGAGNRVHHRAADAKHLAEELLGQGKGAATATVITGQKPAGRTILNECTALQATDCRTWMMKTCA
jgi:hypothetical protein